MTTRPQDLADPLPLRDGAFVPATLEARAAAHLRRCAEIGIPAAPPVRQLGSPSARPRWRPAPVAVLAAMFGLVLAGLAGAVGVRHMMARTEETTGRAAVEPGRVTSHRPAPPPLHAVPEASLAHRQAPSTALPPRNRPTARHDEPARPRSVETAEKPAPPAVVSSLAEETAVLESALRKLRRERDAAGALAALDGYGRSFPGGVLAREAETTRVEALLVLGRGSAALGVLERMAFGTSPRDTELQLTRGTLRADAGRCLEAEDDLTQVLARAASRAASERALWTRASCRSRRADWAGARTDLERYLQRFPDGRFSSEARRALSTM